MYAQRLAEEGFNERLEQLFLELLGPVYSLTSRSSERVENGVRVMTYGKDGRWESSVAGVDKRKLLREILDVTGKFRELQALNVQYDTALKELEESEMMID
jgi:protein HIRA/HIR1